MNKIPAASKACYEMYLKEKKRVESEIWSLANVKEQVVIDVGIGDSTKKLVELGAKVIGIDNDRQKVMKAKKDGIPSILCDFLQSPFQRMVVDMVVFYFTLHEIDPNHHKNAILIAKELAPKVLIVEPSPEGCKSYKKFAKLWREAMHSIGRIEDYKPLKYWKSLLEEVGFIVECKTVSWRSAVPFIELEKIVNATIDEWKRMSVNQEFIEKIREFLGRVKKTGMRWSDINVLFGIL